MAREERQGPPVWSQHRPLAASCPASCHSSRTSISRNIGPERPSPFPRDSQPFRKDLNLRRALWWRIQLPVQQTQVQSLGQEGPRWRRGNPTPLTLPGKPHGQRSLEGYSPGVAKSDRTGTTKPLSPPSSWHYRPGDRAAAPRPLLRLLGFPAPPTF